MRIALRRCGPNGRIIVLGTCRRSRRSGTGSVCVTPIRRRRRIFTTPLYENMSL